MDLEGRKLRCLARLLLVLSLADEGFQTSNEAFWGTVLENTGVFLATAFLKE